jgi:6-pyruvoyltetrahydropterin/6-carboxytetrahydropterin synthase
MSERLTTVSIAKENLSFSIAHFTIFSATERENLHGHTYRVSAKVVAPVKSDGLAFDYAILKKKLKELCNQLDELTIIPEHSPHLKVTRGKDSVTAIFNGEKLTFLSRDAKVLPIANTSLEEFADWFVKQLVNDAELKKIDLRKIVVNVASSPGQACSSEWLKK